MRHVQRLEVVDDPCRLSSVSPERARIDTAHGRNADRIQQ